MKRTIMVKVKISKGIERILISQIKLDQFIIYLNNYMYYANLMNSMPVKFK